LSINPKNNSFIILLDSSWRLVFPVRLFDYSDFVIAVARKFEELIGRATPEEDATFFKIIKIAFESVGSPFTGDPTFPIKQAFKKMAGK